MITHGVALSAKGNKLIRNNPTEQILHRKNLKAKARAKAIHLPTSLPTLQSAYLGFSLENRAINLKKREANSLTGPRSLLDPGEKGLRSYRPKMLVFRRMYSYRIYRLRETKNKASAQ